MTKPKGLSLLDEKRFLALINSDDRMTGHDLKVAMGDLSYADEDTGLICPKVPTVARKVHVSEDTVTRSRERLVRHGYYKVVMKSNGGRSRPSHYRAVHPSKIKVPKGEASAKPPTPAGVSKPKPPLKAGVSKPKPPLKAGVSKTPAASAKTPAASGWQRTDLYNGKGPTAPSSQIDTQMSPETSRGRSEERAPVNGALNGKHHHHEGDADMNLERDRLLKELSEAEKQKEAAHKRGDHSAVARWENARMEAVTRLNAIDPDDETEVAA